MSGGSVAYNLRPNKYVERQLFIEVLKDLYAEVPIEELVYVSLGGPQLEDPKYVHYQLGIETLISLEVDPTVYKRQLFNLRPHIDCKNERTGDFIRNLDSSFDKKHLIIWLDYASSNERLQQLEEYEALISQLGPGDTVKITLNANPVTLGSPAKGEPMEETLAKRLDKLKQSLGDYLPNDASILDVSTGEKFVLLLCRVIETAALKAQNRMTKLTPTPVAVFSYNDGSHQMITVTVHIVPTMDVAKLHGRLSNAKWEYLPKTWTEINYIDMPNLTAKERLFIEGMLFRAPTKTLKQVHNKLPFRFDSEEEVSLRRLEQFAKHYRRYPSFLPVSL